VVTHSKANKREREGTSFLYCQTANIHVESDILTEEKLPISESIEVIEATTIFKSEKWWAAVALVKSFGRKQLAVYLWNKRDNLWKRRQKFVVRNKAQWAQFKEAIERLLPELP
jgi:hypothetical protein